MTSSAATQSKLLESIENSSPRRSRWRRIQRVYVVTAILLLNTFIVYLLLNLLLGLGFAVRDGFRVRSNPVSETYGSRLDAVYPDLSVAERTQMLSEAWNRPYRYADFIHFQERPCAGKYVNVHEAGFRHSIDQGPWPPDAKHFNVFCFGGSTTFGYGVADDQTVASYLQQELSSLLKRRVCVYNFGVGWHFSTQERLRFELLLAQDIVPDVALFLDGINDSTQAAMNRPAFSPQLAAAFEQSQAFGFQSPATAANRSVGGALADALFYRWPVGRLTRGLVRSRSQHVEPVVLNAKMAKRSCDVYRWNRTLLAAAARARDVIPVFVLQPAPGYQLDTKKHPFANLDLCRNEALFYEALKQETQVHPPGDNFIWCAELPVNAPGPLYVDTCHYTPSFSRVIAEEIADQCLSRGVLKPQRIVRRRTAQQSVPELP